MSREGLQDLEGSLLFHLLHFSLSWKTEYTPPPCESTFLCTVLMGMFYLLEEVAASGVILLCDYLAEGADLPAAGLACSGSPRAANPWHVTNTACMPATSQS